MFLWKWIRSFLLNEAGKGAYGALFVNYGGVYVGLPSDAAPTMAPSQTKTEIRKK
uniref:Uncharacterized protein n=1 Tax=Pelusios castaneus TaxID=367368 RepID=A0A8C8RV64_9SAUR